MIRKQVICFILFSLIGFSVDAKDEFCSNKEINPAVQLQNNGWLRIVDQYVAEYSPEEFYKGDEQLIKMHKESVKMGIAREKIRELNVRIQFLKPCIATTEVDEWVRKQNPSGDPDALLSLTDEKGKCIALLIKSYEAMQKSNKEKADEMTKEAARQCGNIEDYINPRFRCDYRFKVFLTSFSPSKSKKYASDTDGRFPETPIIDIKDNRINRKEEMLPGETMWIKFYITGTATSWCVWVPK
jgi:hypothetical protein